ncbi:MAG TPA: M20/M25/M40 family metallo-hydrolase, partial [Terriglobales bacterium]|nr:M20/M25/M40 family metallo-hydrolase [Terriglobales bacterium]
EVLERLRGAVAPHAQIEAVVAGKGIATDPADPWVVHVFDLVEAVAGRRPQAAAAPYFTDGAFLKAACGDPPTLILGPGEIEQAHKTDEWCEVIKIEQAAEIYWQLARDWCLQG